MNAAIALNGDFSESEAEAFGRLVGRIVRRMANKGIFFFAGVLKTTLGLLGFLVAFSVYATVQAGWRWSTLWVLALAPYFMVLILMFRNVMQFFVYNDFLAHVSRRRGFIFPRMANLPASTVAHVLCATELTSGQPFYMSREMVMSPFYGRGLPKISLAGAVYASAAFPVGFPPFRLSSKRLSLVNGRDDEPPRNLWLSDGGVFNNLGTETFNPGNSGAQIFLPDPSLTIIPRVDLQLVVNASSPPKKVVLSSLLVGKTTLRIMSVLYENTLRPRVQRLMEDQARKDGPIVVDISESPVELADRISGKRLQSDPTFIRAVDTREALREVLRDYEWKVYSDRAARTKTVLSAVGRTAAVRLIRLGYLDTAVACHSHLGTQGINAVPDEGWFKNLVDDKLSPQQLVAPAAPTK